MLKAWRAFKDPRLPNNYFRVEVIILRYLGIELIEEETLLYSIISKIFLFYTVVIYTGVEMYEIYVQWGNLNAILGVCNYLITHLMGTVKTAILYHNRKKIGEMMIALHKPPFQPDERRGGKEEERLIRDAIKKTEIQLIVYFLVVSGTVFSGVFNSIILRIRKPKDQWRFPYAPTMTLGDWLTHSPYFELGILYQFWGVLSFAGIIATTYVLLSTIMAHISVQMKILGNAFRNLKSQAEEMAGPLKDDPNVVNKNMETLMRDAVEHHLLSLNLAKEMESLCSLMILSIFIASVILLCFLLYFASLYPLGSIEFFQNFCYWWIIVCQVGMYCFWGNEVSLESDNVAKAVAELDWPGSTKNITHAVGMIICRAQRPLYITAGKFVPLSMEVFMKIIKGSFSYFMVLRQTQGPDA